MIKVENLSMLFSTEEVQTKALNEVTFEIEKGEFVAIMDRQAEQRTTAKLAREMGTGVKGRGTDRGASREMTAAARAVSTSSLVLDG